MTTLAASILERAGERVGEYLPRLGGALALLFVGLILAYVVGRVLRRALIALGTEIGRAHV